MIKLRHREPKEITSVQPFTTRIGAQDYGSGIYLHNHFTVSGEILTIQFGSRKLKRYIAAERRE